MPLQLAVPTASPAEDAQQYIPLLLSAIEGFLQLQSVWASEDYEAGFSFMEDLKQYVVNTFGEVGEMPIIGEIRTLMHSTLPTGWLWCDNSVLHEVADYPDLYAEIGRNFTLPADAEGTFRVMDMSDVSPFGIGSVLAGIGDTAGEIEHTLTTPEMPSHNHAPGTGLNFIVNVSSGGTANWADGTRPRTTSPNTSNTGGGQPHNNLHPVVGVRFIVYAGGV